MKQDEFDGYLGNLVQEAKRLNTIEGEPGKAWFQGAVLGLLACDKESAFTSEQVVQIIKTVLDYEKAPGNKDSQGA